MKLLHFSRKFLALSGAALALAFAACSPTIQVTPGGTGGTGQTTCAAPQKMCGTACIDVASNAANCGDCGIVCSGATPFCSANACTGACGVGTTQCGTSCCGSDTICSNGQCVPPVVGTGGASGVGGGGVGVGGSGVGVGGTGVGGTAVGTGGTAVGTGGTAPVDCGEDQTKPLTGYHQHAPWSGFAFTFVDTAKQATITPTDFSAMAPDADGPYCVSGNVPGTEDYSAIAAVGFNVAQNKEHCAVVNKTATTGSGIFVDLKVNSGATTLRVQLEDGTDPMAADAADHRWCSNITTTDGVFKETIPWEAFNTQCWDNKGLAFDPSTQLAKAIVYVPDAGAEGGAQPFDFCVNGIGPADVESRGEGQIIASCPSNGTTWNNSTNAQFQNIASGSYNFQTNQWNGSGAAFQLIPGGGFEITAQPCNTTTDAPCSFPSVYVGVSADGVRSSGYSAKQISAIGSIPTCFGWSSGGTPASDEYNVSYDVWFNSNSGASGAEKFLMVWFRDPPNFQPGGMFPIANGVVIGSQVWQVWEGPNHANQTVISYVAPSARADGQAYSFNLKDFIDDAVDRGTLTPNQYLISVMGGMEIWGGANKAKLTGFTVQVQ